MNYRRSESGRESVTRPEHERDSRGGKEGFDGTDTGDAVGFSHRDL